MENPSPETPPPLRLATMGEALIDLIARPDGLYEPCLGGAVYNLTRALARQGARVDYLNPLSADANGQALRQALLRDGARVAVGTPTPRPTSLAIAHLDPSGQAHYSFYREQVADRATDAATLETQCAELPGLDAVCTGCLALAPADADIVLPWLRGQRRQQRRVVIDANLRPAAMPDMTAYRQHLWQALGLADLIKASDDDLRALFGYAGDPIAQGREVLARTAARVLALTLGARGAVLLLADGRAWTAHDSQAVTLVDTVGAGDCFLAGLLVQLPMAKPDTPPDRDALPLPDDAIAHRALAAAVASASLCVMRRGCAAPRATEVAQRAPGVIVTPLGQR